MGLRDSHEMWEFGYRPRIGEVKEFQKGSPENTAVLGVFSSYKGISKMNP